jgi:hypothetical protein
MVLVGAGPDIIILTLTGAGLERTRNSDAIANIPSRFEVSVLWNNMLMSRQNSVLAIAI